MVPHGYQWAEIAPAGPLIWEALAPFITLCLVGFAFAWVWLNRQLVLAVGGFISGLVSHVPFVGSAAASVVRDLEKAIIAPLANAERYLDNRMGTCWHKLARVYDRISADLVRLAQLSLLITLAIAGGLRPGQWRQVVALVKHFIVEEIHHLHGLLHSTVTHITYLYPTVTRNIAPALQRLLHSVAVDLPRELDRLRTRERQIAHEVDVTIPRDIARLRKEAQAVEDHAIGLFRWLRTHPTAAASTAFAGAIAVALQSLGLSWIRCSSAPGFFRKYGCGAWNLIDDLLGFAADFLILANICQVIPLLEEAFSAVAAPLIGTLAGVGAGLCAGSAGPPEVLPPPGLVLPPLQALDAGLP